MAQVLVESNLRFQFKEGLHVLKLDETTFHTKRYNVLQGSKGVDFLVIDEVANTFYFIEIKNFTGHEAENRERLIVNSEKSLALETALKVRSSLACLLGAFKYGNINGHTDITPYFKHIRKENVEIKVILFLEGNIHDQTKVFRALTDEMKSKLRWLTTKVLVENISTASRHNIYTLQRLATS